MDEKDLRLLIVDDEEAARYGMRRALETFGGEIAEAENAEAARALMRDRKCDLVLLDVNLPGISGLEFLNELQQDSQENKTEAPLVICLKRMKSTGGFNVAPEPKSSNATATCPGAARPPAATASRGTVSCSEPR